jgi:hypothetical protein
MVGKGEVKCGKMVKGEGMVEDGEKEVKGGKREGRVEDGEKERIRVRVGKGKGGERVKGRKREGRFKGGKRGRLSVGKGIRVRKGGWSNMGKGGG